MYDIIILGAGPAGLSAAIYCTRGRARTLVVGDLASSRTSKAHLIDNYFGFPEGISGPQLMQLGIDHVTRFGGEVISGEVVAIRTTEQFEVELATGAAQQAKAVILATGVSSKPSGIAREEEFVGKGVSYCASCDAFFFRNRPVAVVGEGNYAAKEVFELLPQTRQITLVSHNHSFEIAPNLVTELSKREVVLVTDRIVEFVGDDVLEGLRLGSGQVVSCDGAFLALGTASSLDFARTLGLQMEGNYIAIDKSGRTNLPGIFAAGDCTGPPLQIAKAVGEGCAAATAALAFIRGKRARVGSA
ncbi:MAG: FAD-dependent oxidoreductase [Chloroflexi bacterium]|nr:FAD-dependent oxidoreductase [Chloroflexota bacterium]